MMLVQIIHRLPSLSNTLRILLHLGKVYEHLLEGWPRYAEVDELSSILRLN